MAGSLLPHLLLSEQLPRFLLYTGPCPPGSAPALLLLWCNLRLLQSQLIPVWSQRRFSFRLWLSPEVLQFRHSLLSGLCRLKQHLSFRHPWFPMWSVSDLHFLELLCPSVRWFPGFLSVCPGFLLQLRTHRFLSGFQWHLLFPFLRSLLQSSCRSSCLPF